MEPETNNYFTAVEVQARSLVQVRLAWYCNVDTKKIRGLVAGVESEDHRFVFLLSRASLRHHSCFILDYLSLGLGINSTIGHSVYLTTSVRCFSMAMSLSVFFLRNDGSMAINREARSRFSRKAHFRRRRLRSLAEGLPLARRTSTMLIP